jgi:adhesin/invasin
LGAVDPPVASGAAAPLDSVSTATASVTATVGGQPATVIFAGLAPGFAGLYQVNLIVPQLAPGSYPVQIAAGSVTSNQATITVR